MSGKVALITGGQGDLASTLADGLLTSGYQVLAPGRSEMDVTSQDAVSGVFSGLDRLDLLICNAAVLADHNMARLGEEDWDRVLDVGLTGAFRTSQAALKLMARQRSGHIVFIGSFSGIAGRIGQANYAAAKAGLIGLASSLAREYGGRNVRVNTILPGYMEGKMTAHLSDETRQSFRESHVLRRFNTAAEVAGFVVFLDAGLPHTSGQVFNLDSRIPRWT